MVPDVISHAEDGMRHAEQALEHDLAAMRTGRASPGLVERVIVDYYGVATPLNQMATVSAPEARLLVIQPWDKSSMASIEKAILKSDVGLTPSNDGRVIRLQIPTLTEERRKDLVKIARRRVEEGRVAVRNCRRQALEDVKALEKDHAVSEDEIHRMQEQLQRVTDSVIAEIDRLGQRKELEVMEV